MQWRCPHCGVVLAVPQNTLISGWSFSRCYKCGGFALVRKSEISVIKLDSIPPGEQVILPEASHDIAVGMMGQDAVQKITKHIQNRNQGQDKSSQDKSLMMTASNISNTNPQPTLKQPPQMQKSPPIPAPLPELSSSSLNASSKSRFQSSSLSTAVIAIASGFYLFSQGHAFLFQNNKNSAYDSKPTDTLLPSNTSQPSVSAQQIQLQSYSDNETRANVTKQREAMREPQREQIRDQIHEKLGEELAEVAHKQPHQPIVSDQLQQRAMAPLTPTTLTQLPKPSAPMGTKLENNFTSQSKESTAMKVEIRTKKAKLHSGPGLEYPVIAMADSQSYYSIVDWNDRWFKIVIPSVSKDQNKSPSPTYGWIRNDLVKVKSGSNSL